MTTTQQHRIERAMNNDKTEPWVQAGRWHMAKWGPWGDAETAIKGVAIITAFLAAFPTGALRVPETNQVSFWILVGLAVAYVLSIGDRLIDKEITALGFLGFNLVGHWSIVYAMGATSWPTTSVKAFALLMLIGDLIKLGFFVTTGARVRNLPRIAPIMLTASFAALYAVAFAYA
ncbi:MAG: hypothetical protein AAF467_14725 [Actinomycetota bacterium]